MHCQSQKMDSYAALNGCKLQRSRPLQTVCSFRALLPRLTCYSASCGNLAPGRKVFVKATVATSSPSETQSLSLWNGADEFSCYNDRIDAPPLPLPPISEPVRVVIVRHGQSTWNAEGRIQGSTDLSVLTKKGLKQAQKARDMLSSVRFSCVFESPLTRARQTADEVLQDREAEGCSGVRRETLPSLREVDLYQFQGLLKDEGKSLYGDQYKRWQKAPHLFELDGHAPVRELWYRASLAWRSLLQQPEAADAGGAAVAAAADPRVILVVAHNAINQALVATALGLPPSYFRRLPQNNAALSVFDFEPGCSSTGGGSTGGGGGGGGIPPQVTLSCLNQSPDNPFKNPDKVVANVALITPTSVGNAGGPAAVAELRRLAAVLGKLQVTHVLAAQDVGAATISALLEGQPASLQFGGSTTSSTTTCCDQNRFPAAQGAHPTAATVPPVGDLQQQQSAESSADDVNAAAAVSGVGYGAGVAVEFFPRGLGPTSLWERAVALAATQQEQQQQPGEVRRMYGNVLVILDEESHAGAIWAALGLAGNEAGAALRVAPGGVSVVEFAADPRTTPATVRCINNTAHVVAPAPAPRV